jgi:hypothetical protein
MFRIILWQTGFNSVCLLLLGMCDIWMGIRKPDNFSDVHDFRYYSDGKPIEYEYWSKPDPNNQNNNEYCVLAKGYNQLRWHDVPCTLHGSLICQLWRDNIPNRQFVRNSTYPPITLSLIDSKTYLITKKYFSHTLILLSSV